MAETSKSSLFNHEEITISDFNLCSDIREIYDYLGNKYKSILFGHFKKQHDRELYTFVRNYITKYFEIKYTRTTCISKPTKFMLQFRYVNVSILFKNHAKITNNVLINNKHKHVILIIDVHKINSLNVQDSSETNSIEKGNQKWQISNPYVHPYTELLNVQNSINEQIDVNQSISSLIKIIQEIDYSLKYWSQYNPKTTLPLEPYSVQKENETYTYQEIILIP